MSFVTKKATLLIIVLTACTFAAVSFALKDSISGDSKSASSREHSGEFTVGVLAPKEGVLSLRGENIKRGAVVAKEILNSRGGILGRSISLELLDNTRSTSSSKIIKEKIESNGISLLVGSAGEDATIAATEIAEEMRVPLIYSENGPLKTCQKANRLFPSDFVWGAGLTGEMTVETFLVNLADKLRKPEQNLKVYYFSTEDEAASSEIEYARSIAESLQFETMADERVDARIRDYFQKVRKIFDKSPELLYVSTSPGATQRFIEQSSKLGVKSEMAIAGLQSFEEENTAGAGKALDGIYTGTRYYVGLDNPQNKEFLQKWQDLYPKTLPTALAAATYGAVITAAEAFNKAKTSDPMKFKQAMDDLEISLPQGRIVVSKYNHLFIQPFYLVRANEGRYELLDYLGDVSHPLLEGCTIPDPTIEEPQAPRSHYDDDSE